MRSGAGPEPRLGERPPCGAPSRSRLRRAAPGPPPPLSRHFSRPPVRVGGPPLGVGRLARLRGGGCTSARGASGGCPRRPRRGGAGRGGAPRCAAATLDVRRALLADLPSYGPRWDLRLGALPLLREGGARGGRPPRCVASAGA